MTLLSCLFCTAVWLGKCQSILTLKQQPNELDVASYRISLFGSITCSQVGPVLLEWPVALTGGLDKSSPSLLQEDVTGEHRENAHPAPPHLRWRRDSLQLPKVQRTRSSRNTCVHIPDGLRCVTWITRGLIGSPPPPQFSREKSTTTSLHLPRTTTSSVCTKFMRRRSFYRLFRFWPRKINFTNSKTLVEVATDRNARCL